MGEPCSFGARAGAEINKRKGLRGEILRYDSVYCGVEEEGLMIRADKRLIELDDLFYLHFMFRILAQTGP